MSRRPSEPFTTVRDAPPLDERGEGPPLVLVHGLATSRVVWRRVMPMLPGRVLAPDVPGFGAAPPAGAGFDLARVAGAIAGALHDAGVPTPYDLVGHSLGGAVAMTLAAREPEAVGRLVLVAPAGLRPMPALAARALGRGAAVTVPLRRRAGVLAGSAWGRRLLMSPSTAAPAALPPAEVRAMLDASGGSARIAAALAAVATADLRPLLRSLPVPVGAIWGMRDRIVPSGGVHAVRVTRPEAPIATLPDSGHIPMMEQPEAFVAALGRVLAALDPRDRHAPRA